MDLTLTKRIGFVQLGINVHHMAQHAAQAPIFLIIQWIEIYLFENANLAPMNPKQFQSTLFISRI